MSISGRYISAILLIAVVAVVAIYADSKYRSEVRAVIKPGAYIEFRVVGPRESQQINAPPRKEIVKMTVVESNGAQTETTGTRTFAKRAMICASDWTCGEDVITTKDCGPLMFLYSKKGLYCITCRNWSNELNESVSPRCPLRDDRVRKEWALANWQKNYIDDPTIKDPVEEFLRGKSP
jgi:hypothetical protein